MVTVTGKLESSINSTNIKGIVDVMLCGYGSRVPRANGVALIARISDDAVAVANDGTFTFTCPSNEDIVPAGTYYAITIRDDNGDVAQINAYRFLNTPPTYDLNLIDPYDPNIPPPPLPLPITNELLILGGNVSPVAFPGDVYTAFSIDLETDITATIQGMIPGNLYTFIIVQDGAGGHAFLWPPQAHNATIVDKRPNKTTIQTFVADENGELYAIAPGTVQP